MRTGRDGGDLVFGATRDRVFTPTHVRNCALKAWERAGLAPIGLHELRHSYVSTMHAAGSLLEQIGDYVGHSSNYMTDAYRHLLAGHEQAAAERFEQYLNQATGASTGAQGL